MFGDADNMKSMLTNITHAVLRRILCPKMDEVTWEL